MKYIDSEKLLAEIDSMLSACTKQTHTGVFNTCTHFKGLITSLQQEQPVNMIQWTGSNLQEVIDFTGKSPKFGEWFKSWDELESYVHSHGDILKLFSDDGSHFEVPVGAWIVKTPDGYNVPSVARFIHAKQEQPQLPGIEDHGIPGKDFIPVEWVDACEMYGKWKIVKLDKPEVDIENEITEHAINMPHCEFSHDSEDREHEEWAMKEFRYFYELGLNARKEQPEGGCSEKPNNLLHEQPEVDLEKEIDRFWDSCIKHKNERGGNVIWSNKIEIKVLARHFAEWGAIHLNAKKGVVMNLNPSYQRIPIEDRYEIFKEKCREEDIEPPTFEKFANRK